MTIGWQLDREQRAELLRRFPPAYAEAVADHVTFKPGPGDAPALPPLIDPAIVARADDGAGVEAMVVRIAGTTARPDGSRWHITWSLAPGRTAWESNLLLAAGRWALLPQPIALRLNPAAW